MNPAIAQLRGTIFVPKTIGFSDEMKSRFIQLLPDGQVQPVMLPIPPQDPFLMGQQMIYGGPWKIVKDGRSIIFNQVNVDVIENRVNDQISSEDDFVKFCVNVFETITKFVNYNTRMAYAPTFAMDEVGDFKCKDWWETMFASTSVAGMNMQDINLKKKKKKGVDLNDKKLTLNIHHKIFDGYRCNQNNIKTNDSIIVTLDINTVQDNAIELDTNDVSVFFEKAIDEKKKLMKNYFGV